MQHTQLAVVGYGDRGMATDIRRKGSHRVAILTREVTLWDTAPGGPEAKEVREAQGLTIFLSSAARTLHQANTTEPEGKGSHCSAPSQPAFQGKASWGIVRWSGELWGKEKLCPTNLICSLAGALCFFYPTQPKKNICHLSLILSITL